MTPNGDDPPMDFFKSLLVSSLDLLPKLLTGNRQVELSSCGQNYPSVVTLFDDDQFNRYSRFNYQFNYPFVSHSPHVQ